MDYHVTQMSPEAADEWTRRVYNVGADTRLGWTPYNYLVSHRAVSTFACYTERELQNWLSRYNLHTPAWSDWKNGVRSAFLTSTDTGKRQGYVRGL
jgi:hypothetical protein